MDLLKTRLEIEWLKLDQFALVHKWTFKIQITVTIWKPDGFFVRFSDAFETRTEVFLTSILDCFDMNKIFLWLLFI